MTELIKVRNMKGLNVLVCVLLSLSAACGTRQEGIKKNSEAGGPFEAEWESLKKYKCPEWFRDAKLGIWAVWGPQAVPKEGDWYARNMYIEGTEQYQYHLEHYGRPSKFGYKDIVNLWKAENWDPNALMAKYKKAGAKYFAVIAVHHDNFDCWDSKYHKWNSVNMGPKKDIVGMWKKAADIYSLRFGVTEHLERSYSWFNVNKGADKSGSYAGVPYDGADANYADFYFPPHIDTTYAYPENPPEWWKEQWYNRIKDLIDSYQPDLLYTDGGSPFGQVGREIIAYFYNENLKHHGGSLEAVYNIKDYKNLGNHGEYQDGAAVLDIERGVVNDIRPQPWQTDTCVGEWYYHKGIQYKSAKTIIAMLADIVSKNGNLLLNFPLRPDGTLDEEEEKILKELADWMAVNSEAIYATRPWLVYGEGPSRVRAGYFAEDSLGRQTARDIRFTTKGSSLYAIVLDWPLDGKVTIRSLAKSSGKKLNRIKSVSLLGAGGKLNWSQDEKGLKVTLPDKKPCENAYVLKIEGKNLTAIVAENLTEQEDDGSVVLKAIDAQIIGDSPVYETGGGKDNIGYWGNPDDYVKWNFKIDRPGAFEVEVSYSCDNGREGSEYTISVDNQILTYQSKSTGSWAAFRKDKSGTIEIKKAGKYILSVKPKVPPEWKVIGLQSVKLVPLKNQY